MTTPVVTTPVAARARTPAPSTSDGADVGQEQHEREVERDEPLGAEPVRRGTAG